MVQVAAQDQDKITDGMDDDIISGCYVLDIGIHIPVSRLWIRADYTRVFNFFKAFYDNPMAKVPSGVLTGQPGIGESSCTAFISILLKFVRHGKSV